MAARRNLVIYLASGLRSDALEDERAWPLRTPQFGRLARRGLRLVATSACPADPGGLITLLTGLHARQHGYAEPETPAACVTGLPTWLADAGYHVAGVGCLGPFASTFTESVLVEPASAVEPTRCAYAQAMHAKGLWTALAQQRKARARGGPFEPDRLLLDAEDDIDGYIADEARRVVAGLPSDRPWALVVVFAGPGNDLPPPVRFADAVDITLLGDGFTPADLKRLDALAEPAYPLIQLQRLERHTLAQIRADYLGRVALLDESIGQIADAVTHRSDRARTWSMVASDMGYLLGEHGLIGRRSFLCGAVETPLIVAAPSGGRLPHRAQDAGLFSTVDVAATAAALAGADVPEACVGRSLLPLWGGDAIGPLKGGLLSEFGERVLLETERFKAVFDARPGDGGGDCLGVFDLLNDPDERKKQSNAAAGQNLIDSLRLRLCEALLPLRAVPR